MHTGNVRWGKSPVSVDLDKPVLVFVPGLMNDSSIWYEGNDMCERAQTAGYETVFVELHDSCGNSKSYWENGRLLASHLEKIHLLTPGKELVLICYSKGGVDAQTALVHEGKHELVSDVVTIGSPHYGSELADLAASPPFIWLAEWAGRNNEGVKSLQTGAMSYFREITDNRKEVSKNRYYTMAGNWNGPIFSSYWFGGGFIGGENDGVVSTSGASLPGAEMLAVGRWNHGQVHLGQNAFPLIEPVLKGETPSPVRESAEEEAPSLHILVRGGLEQQPMETFHVEKEAEKIVINWMSPRQLETLTVTSPGKEPAVYDVEAVKDDTGFFDGIYHHLLQWKNPAPGEWTVSSDGFPNLPYGFTVSFDSPLNKELYVQRTEKEGVFTVHTDGEIPEFPDKMFMELLFYPAGTPGREEVLRYSQELFGREMTLPVYEEGTYNLSVEIEGKTKSGGRYQRTVSQSAYRTADGAIR
jgi:pimeloyl-ACP methyl ester carboxylesterase